MTAATLERPVAKKKTDTGGRGRRQEAKATAVARVYEDLYVMLDEVSRSGNQTIADLVEESPLRVWVMERYVKLLRQRAKEADAIEKQLADLKGDRKPS